MKHSNIFPILLFICVLVFLGWLFSNIVIYIFLALILSIIGAPFVKLLQKISVKGKSIPSSVAAAITLLLIITIFSLFFYLMIPVLINELKLLSSIQPEMFKDQLELWMSKIDDFLISIGLFDKNEHLSDLFVQQFKSFISTINFTNLAGNIFSFLVSILIAVFSILFLTFFSLKDNKIFFKMIRKIIPVNYRESFDRILQSTKNQLVKYFSGVFLEMFIVGFLEGLLCYLAGIPNALLIGIIGGSMNIIPYVGPLVSFGISSLIAVTSQLPLNPDTSLLTMTVIKIAIVFSAVNLLDNFVLQPNIYGNTVRAHPIEIFIVILVAGYIGGILGMIFAVPAYSLVRIIVKEFFGKYYDSV